MTDQFSKWQEASTRDKVSVSVCFDRALLDELSRAEQRLHDAETASSGMLGGDADSLRAAVQEVRARASDNTHEITFEALGRRRWRSLVSEHPPTDEQIAELKKKGLEPEFNAETFPPAAMAASCIEPGMSIEQARWIMDELPEGVFVRIWGACLEANVSGGRDPFGAAIGHPQATKRKSTPRSNSASPSRSS